MKLIIRDGYATLNGNKETFEMPSGNLDIITEDGRNLFGVRLNKDGSIEVSAGDVCKVDGVLLDDQLRIKPIACNVVQLRKPIYNEN